MKDYQLSDAAFQKTDDDPRQDGFKREHFAGLALQGLLARYSLNTPEDQKTITKMAVELSDELLKQLSL